MLSNRVLDRCRLVILFLCVAVVALSACKAENALVGKWQDEEGYIMEFFKDGTVTFSGGYFTVTGNYKFTDDTHIRLDLQGLWGLFGPQVVEVRIAGNTLTMKDSTGIVSELRRVK